MIPKVFEPLKFDCTSHKEYTPIKTQDLLNMEFTPKYGIWELLSHEKNLETHVLATLLTGNARLFNEKKISCISASYFRIFRFFEVCVTQV